MRSYLCIALFALSPAAIAVGQAPVDPNNPIGNQPPQVAPGDIGGPGPRGPAGPPPNMLFAAIDTDGDGVITKSELRRAVVQLRKLDTDRDGNITLAEVSPAGGPGAPGADPALFLERVMQSDLNNDGQLTPDEIPDRMKPMVADADVNKDNVITRDELMATVQNMRNAFPNGAGPGGWANAPAGRQPGVGNRANDPNQLTGQLLRNDRNNDGMLSSDELPRNMRNMFQKGDDQNGDGSLDARELQAVVRRMGDRGRALRGGLGADRNDRGRGRDNDRDDDPNRDEN